MSTEAQTRPAASRGRGGARGGRGGSSRGGSRQQTRSATNGDSKHQFDAFDEDDGDVAELKKLYGAKAALIKEMFPDWSEADILYALKEHDGDENLTSTRIAEGLVTQWGEVSKQKKDRSKPKPSKDATFTTTTGDNAPAYNRPSRGGRGDGARGRGRATERGGRSTRGRPSPAGANGTHVDKSELSVPTEESSAWDNPKTDDAPAWGTPAAETTSAPKPAAPAPTPAAPAQKPATATWASMLRQSTAPKPAPPKPKAAPVPPPAAEVIEPLPPVAEPAVEEPEPVVEQPKEVAPEVPVPEIAPVAMAVVPEVALPPSQDQLTETNLEQITDTSHPPETETARSEAADSWDPRQAALSATATPLSASQQQHQAAKASQAATSGYATTAAKATERSATRTPSYGRRLLDQEEAVRMPNNRELDRTTVQFGALNFSGQEDDIDGDREEAETRTQPPVDSPVSHPRTSLPVAQPAAIPDAFAAQKPAATPTAVPTAPAVPSAIAPQQPAAVAPAPQQPPATQASQAHQGFSRFGPASQDQQSYGQKPYDAFGQQNASNIPPTNQHQYDGFPSQSQPHSQAPAPAAAPAAMSSAPNDFSSFYTADPQNRGPYSYYNQHYTQQGSQGHQEGPQHAQRSLSGYSTSQNDALSQYPQSGAQAPAARYGAGLDAQNSGNNTPNPTGQNQPQAAQNAQSQPQAQQQHGNQYGYAQHPYSYSPYYSNYMNNQPYASGYGQGGYAPYGSKGGVYGQASQYGMTPQAPYEHASSGGSGGFGQSSLHRGDSGLGSGLGDYGRASAQSGQQGLGGGFGGMHDNFGRGSSYQSQAGQGFNNQNQQPGNPAGGNDDLKPFGDSKGAGGPSPSISGARPMSAANNAQSQQGLPPSQSGQQGAGGMGGYGGYPSHLQQQQQGHGVHGGQTGAAGFGAGAGQQGHGNNPYGGYGNQSFGGASYYGTQPRGWGNNYH